MIESALASRLIERGGYVRRARPLVGRYKEWLHFCVARPNLDLLVNFSLSEENDASQLVARMLCAVRTDEWAGDVETIPQSRLELRPGRLHLSFGENVIRFRNGCFHVRAELERRRIAVELELRPVALPSLVNNIAGGDGTPIHWFLVPRLLATGHVKVGDRVHVLDRALAYHDHNWGGFQWGRDFSWIWGYGHPEQPSNPWSFTFDRFMNRARTTDVARGLLVWKGARQHRLFANAEIDLSSEGFLRPTRVLKLPRPMALLHEQSATDVPQRVFIRARGRNDALDVEIGCQEVLQILVPDDHGLGVTAITEVVSEILVDGRIRGEKVVMRGRGVFEFLGGSNVGR